MIEPSHGATLVQPGHGTSWAQMCIFELKKKKINDWKKNEQISKKKK